MFTKETVYINGIKSISVDGVQPYSLSDTLECGQCFRFERVSDSTLVSEYTGIAYGRHVRVGQDEGGRLLFIGTPDDDFEKIWIKYFALDTSLNAVRAEILKNAPEGNKLHLAAEAAKGIAILRQEPWEALFSFIVSQNNNIPRIKKIIKTVCESYGKRVEGDLGYAFPCAEEIIAKPEGLESARVGFRLRYLLDAAKRVCEKETDLCAIQNMGDYSAAKAELMKITGVGSKVADCVLLYGMNYLSAFPIDVWIRQAMGEYFTDTFTPESLGRYAGMAQQYIFHFARVLEKEGGGTK